VQCLFYQILTNVPSVLLAPTSVTIKPDPKTGIVTLNWSSSVDRFLVEVDTGAGFNKVWEGSSKTCPLQVDDPCAFNVRVYSVSNSTPPRQSEHFELRSFVPGEYSLIFLTHLFYDTGYLQANYLVLRLLRTKVLLNEEMSRFLGIPMKRRTIICLMLLLMVRTRTTRGFRYK
jgi:hypothetical protein